MQGKANTALLVFTDRTIKTQIIKAATITEKSGIEKYSMDKRLQFFTTHSAIYSENQLFFE
ncbi:MAG: hypothetical protein ABR502_08740, partial [Chitinophagaceae bacterium]